MVRLRVLAVASGRPYPGRVLSHHNPSPSQEPIILNFDKFTGSVLDLMDEDKRHTIIRNMVDHQVNLVKEARLLIETSDALTTLEPPLDS